MPSWFWATVFFVYGAVVGSFLNVCIWRLPREESLWQPPSHCPKCDRRLGVLDLVPLLSQVVLRGRCRYCQAKISWRYFLVELATALVFIGLYFRHGAEGRWVEAITGCIFAAALIVIFFIDLETFYIPDIAIVWGLGAGVVKDVWLIVEGSRSLWRSVPFTDWLVPIPESIVTGAVGALGLLVIAWLGRLIWRKEAMGMGDVLLLAAMGANLSLPCMALAFFIAVFLGGGMGIVLLVFRLKGRQDEIPFGPMLVLGTLATMLFGESILAWYFGWMGIGGGVPSC